MAPRANPGWGRRGGRKDKVWTWNGVVAALPLTLINRRPAPSS